MTKNEQYNNEVIKIYKNPLLNLDEAIEEYLKFRNTQKILKRPKDTIAMFVVYKVTEDYIRKPLQPKSFIEYIYDFYELLDATQTKLRKNNILAYTDVLRISEVCLQKLKNRFKELNPEIVEFNELLTALTCIHGNASICNAINKKLDRLENRIRKKYKIEGCELLARLPLIQDYMEKEYSIMVMANRHGVRLVPIGTPKQIERATKFLDKE